jgi:RHS repeat-associated protein
MLQGSSQRIGAETKSACGNVDNFFLFGEFCSSNGKISVGSVPHGECSRALLKRIDQDSRTVNPKPMNFKALAVAVAVCLVSVLTTNAQTNRIQQFQAAGFSEVGRGLNHRIWEKLGLQTNQDGTVSLRTNQIIELETGLNRWQTNQSGTSLVESRPEITVTTNGVVARGASHQALFASNINTYAGTRVRLPDGRQLKSHILGLAYHDVSSGSNVMFAALQDSTAQIVGNNRVVYRSAFTDVDADVIYTYSRSKVAQDIRINERPPSPTEYGLNPASTHLIAITEFVDTPTPIKRTVMWNSGLETLRDETLDFGSMRMIQGHAFRKDGPNRGDQIRVAKTLETLEGRTVLLERLQYHRIKDEVNRLPASGSNTNAAGSTNASTSKAARWFAKGTLPPAPKLNASLAQPVKTIAAIPEQNSFVVDWENVLDGGDWYFASDTTYFVGGENYLGYAEFESYTFVKYDLASELHVNYNFYYYGGGALPILTSVHDDTAGQTMPQSNHNPQQGDYWGPALSVNCSDLALAQQSLEVRYGVVGVVGNEPCIPKVTIVAEDPTATKGSSDTASFRITRLDASWNEALTVQFAVSGTATSGSDYTSIGTSASIPQGAGSVLVTITPAAQSGTTFEKSIVVSISTHSSYNLQSPSSATIYLYDHSVPLPAPVAAPSQLIAWWRAENNADDSAGANTSWLNDATFVDAFVRKGFSYDGNDRTEINDSAGLDFGNNQDFTIEAWIRPISAATAFGVQSIVDKRYSPNTSTAVGYSLNLVNGKLAAQLAKNPYPSGGWVNYGPVGNDLRDGRFHHVAMTVDRDLSTGGKFYVDGVQVGNSFNPTSMQGDLSNDQKLRIGNHAMPSLNAYFKGLIDEVSLYNRALTGTEIATIYNAGRGGKCLPPTITSQPISQSITYGSDATFSVSAAGSPSYQWRKGGVVIPGATTSTYIITKPPFASSGSTYDVLVSCGGSPMASSSATLTVAKANLTVTADPKVKATGAPLPLFTGTAATIQAGDNIIVKYLTAATATSPAGNYAIVPHFEDPDTKLANYNMTVNNATLTIADPPVITLQPISISRLPGGTATFTVEAIGSPTLTYQWKRGVNPLSNGGNISGANSATLVLTGVAVTPDQATYFVTVANSGGSTNSAAASLTITDPIITQQPISRSVVPGSTVSFNVIAASSSPTYQWLRNGSIINNIADKRLGCTLDTLTLLRARNDLDAGSYKVRVNGPVNQLWSAPATLDVCLLYPIAIHRATVSGHMPGTPNDVIAANFGTSPDGSMGNGDFGWLSWDDVHSAVALQNAWTHALGMDASSPIYIDPEHPSNPNAILTRNKKIHQAEGSKASVVNYLNANGYIGPNSAPRKVVVWDGTATINGDLTYNAYAFATIRIHSISTSGNGVGEKAIMTFELLSTSECAESGTINLPPELTFPGSGLTYKENDPPKIIDDSAKVVDFDSENFEGGMLIADLSGAGRAEDALSIVGQGTSTGQINLQSASGLTHVKYGAEQIGTIVGYLDHNLLKVKLTASATRESVQALLRRLSYHNTSDNPDYVTPRNVQITLQDGDGGSVMVSKNIQITPVNDQPTLSDMPNLTVYAGSGQHTIVLSGITPGGGEDQSVTVGATHDSPGIISGLSVIPNTASTASTRILQFTPPPSGAHIATITVTAQDNGGIADGGVDTITKSFRVTILPPIPTGNIKPTITLPGQTPIYTENNPPVQIDSSATLEDPDSPDFKDGVLTVQFSANGQAQDRLGIRDEGAGANTITVSGTAVKFGGQTFGSMSGGYLTRPLTVSFINNFATKPAVLALIKNITYWNTSEHPSTSSRTVQFIVSDGDGGTSDPASKAINVARANDAPTANPQVVRVVKGTSKAIVLTGFDADGDNLSYMAPSTTSQGTLSGAPPNVTYAANSATFVGQDSFTFTVSDGTAVSAPATITIHIIEAPPLIVDAGADKSGTVSSEIRLDGVVNGTPSADPIWTVVSKPNGSMNPTFKENNAPSTTATFTHTGVYVLKLEADGVFDTTTVTICTEEEAPSDVVLVLDYSDSIIGAWSEVSSAARGLVKLFRPGVHQVALVTFNERPFLWSPLTRDFDAVDGMLAAMSDVGGDTVTHYGLELALAELTGPRRTPGANPVIILLSDGWDNNLAGGDDIAARTANTIKQLGVRIITISMASGCNVEATCVNREFMKSIASGDGDYHFSPSPADLPAIYANTFYTLCFGYRRPLVDAGLDRRVKKEAGVTTVNLSGSIYGGYGQDFGAVSYAWQLSDHQDPPVGFSFNPSANVANPTITFPAGVELGDYKFRLTATFANPAGESPSFDDVVITLDDQVTVGFPPTVKDDFAVVFKNSYNNEIPVLQNDRDFEANPLIIDSVENPSAVQGTVKVINGGTKVSYTPAHEAFGLDTFSYTAKDSDNNTSEAVVWVLISEPAEPPMAVDDKYVVKKNITIPEFLQVLENDSHSASDDIEIISVTSAAHGELNVISGDGVSYLPTTDYEGPDFFTYTIRSSHGNTSTGKVFLQVTPNRNPAPLDDRLVLSVLSGNSDNYWVLFNDGDPDDDLLTVIDASDGAHGTVVVETDSTITYTRTDSFIGQDTFTYTVSDGQGGTATATARIAIVNSEFNNRPVGVISSIDGNNDDTPVVRNGIINVLGTATDPLDLNDGIFYTITARPFDPVNGIILLGGPSSSTNRIGRVSNATLGTLDLTMLTNGSYVLILEVDDGLLDSDPAYMPFILQSQLKIGNFTFSEIDLNISLKGLPLSFVRSYDSQRTASSDFSPGWELAINSAVLHKNMSLGLNWFGDQSFASYCVGDAGPHIVTITFPEGRIYRFAAYAKLQNSPAANPSCANTEGVGAILNIEFSPLPGTPANTSLQFGFSENLVVLPGPDGFNGFVSLSGDGEYPFDDNLFIFAGPEGNKYTFSGGKILSVEDRNQNKVVFSSSGIEHFSEGNTTADKKIAIERDAAWGNRITAIFGPKYAPPTGPAAVIYEYDGNNRLAFVRRLTDASNPSNPTYATTSYRYETQNADFLHYITKIIDPIRQTVLRNEYDENGRLIATIDAYDNRTLIKHDLDKRTEIITDPLGHATSFGYDLRGNILSKTNALGGISSFTYNDHNHRLTATDEIESTTVYQYNYYVANGVETEQIKEMVVTAPHDASLPDSEFQTITRYDLNGQVTEVLVPNQGRTEYSYVETEDANHVKALGKIKTITDAAGGISTCFYRDLPPLDGAIDLEEFDPQFNLTQRFMDELGRKKKILVKPNIGTPSSPNYAALPASLTEFTYDDNGNLVTQTNTRTLPNGLDKERTVLTSFFDDENKLLSTTTHVQTVDSAGNGILPYLTLTLISSPSTLAHYDEAGMKKAETWTRRLNGGSTETVVVSYDHNARGEPTRTIYPDKTFIEVKYDPAGRVTNRIDRAGLVTAYVYDAVGRLTSTVNADKTQTTNRYDSAGHLIASTDARGFTTTYGYDKSGRQTWVTNALGQWKESKYNGSGNLVSSTTLSEVTSYFYDELERLTNTTFTDGTFTRNIYDALGNEVAKCDQGGVQTGYKYDALHRLVAVTNAVGDPDQVITQYQYDEQGNLTQITDAANRVTTFEYDPLGRKIKRVLPGVGNPEIFQYYADDVGNLWKTTDFKMKVTTFEYDSENHLTKKIPDPNLSEPTVEFTYTATGQRETMTDPSGLTKYHYLQGRLWRKETPNGTLAYGYDENGNVTNVVSSSPNGLSVTYKRDALNRLWKVTDNRTSATTEYKYDNEGRLGEMIYPTTTVSKHLYSYDALARLKSVAVNRGSTELASFSYTLGPTGNRTHLDELLNGATRGVTYNYDKLYRLKSEILTGVISGNIVYDEQPGYSESTGMGYDKVGNRQSRSSSVSGISAYGGGTAHVFDVRDRLSVATYDNNGNTTAVAGSGAIYTYDFENRLLSRNNGEITLVYDGDGNRISKNAFSSPTLYLIDDQSPTGYPQVAEELSAVDSTPVMTYTYGLKMISQRSSGGTVQYYGYDGQGSVRLVLNNDGTVANYGGTSAVYTYDAFGILIPTGTAPLGNDYLYAGEQLDRHLGLYYLRSRYYDPYIGRFWTMDPFEGSNEEPHSLHKYLYCHADPVNNVDPSGMYEIDTHLYLTWYLARAAGFPNAADIGIATQSADAPGSTKDAMYGGANRANMDNFHFVSKERLAELRGLMYANPTDLEKIGDYFHALEDTYAHCDGVGDRNWKYYHDADSISDWTDIGHGLHGHDPDFTWKDVKKANAMAKMVFDEFVAFAKHQGIRGASSWFSIQGKVNEFNAFKPMTYTDIVYRRLTETASFEGYTEKIRKLDSTFTIGAEYAAQYKDAAHRGSLRSKLKSRQITVSGPFNSSFLIFSY